MDKFDQNILKLMQEQPTLSVREIGDAIGLSQTPCWRRIKNLEATGVIRGRVVEIDPSSLGLSLYAIILIKMSRQSQEVMNAIEQQFQADPHIIECLSLAGSFEYQLRCGFASMGDYERYLRTVLLASPGEPIISTTFIVKEVKVNRSLLRIGAQSSSFDTLETD